ncbi:FAD-dependent oxidoreductase [Rhodocyclaceae bacterium SMB388]
MSHPTLLSPIRIGTIKLPNRVIMGSMHTNLEELGEAGAPALAAFFAERARNGVALMVTGGYAPNPAGRMKAGPGYLNDESQLGAHRPVTAAVHAAGARILLQILHSGRYGMHADIVAPSPIRAPISRVTPRELDEAGIRQTIRDYAQCAALACAAGYDGIELMGSEGYLLSQFSAPCTNQRDDDWGGSPEKRRRFAIEVVRAVRAALGPDPLLVFRLSLLDLVDGGIEWRDTVALARALEAEGVDLISTGVGWHESPVPTVQQSVPLALFTQTVGRLRRELKVPVAASNRINTPDIAEAVLARGDADLVALARPLLADAAFVAKTRAGDSDTVVPCIACNQACLDHYFTGEAVSCLVNPAAGRELTFAAAPLTRRKRVAVVGGGPAGLAAATTAARRGHQVTLFEADDTLGGQFRLAAHIPGKEDYARVVSAYATMLAEADGRFVLGQPVLAAELRAEGFDDIIIATGVRPRRPDIPGLDSPIVVGYEALLSGEASAGERVAIIGAGGIGFDVAAFLTHAHARPSLDDFVGRWRASAGTTTDADTTHQVWMLKRSPGPFGRSLGKTTGWVLRRELADHRVTQLDGVEYLSIDDGGIHFRRDAEQHYLEVDTIVCCAGQESEITLADELRDAGVSVNVIGGAALAAELDAKRAFEDGVRVALQL